MKRFFYIYWAATLLLVLVSIYATDILEPEEEDEVVNKMDDKENLPEIPHFSVEMFISHNPYIAEVVLPDLFKDFPDSAWRLPRLLPMPERPQQHESKPGKLPPFQWLDERIGTGRYELDSALSRNTTLLELLPLLKKQCELEEAQLAQFKIYPQKYREDDSRQQWHDKPLPMHMTLGDIALFDEDAVQRGFYTAVHADYAPVLQLVIETKAAALKRCLGNSIDDKFYARAFGRTYKYHSTQYHRGNWDRLAFFRDSEDNQDVADYLRYISDNNQGAGKFWNMPKAVDCAEWALPVPNSGTVLALAKHISPRTNSSILYKDLASTLDGGLNAPASSKQAALFGCGKNGGQVGVTAKLSNPLYNTDEYKNSGAKPEGIIIKLVKAPSQLSSFTIEW